MYSYICTCVGNVMEWNVCCNVMVCMFFFFPALVFFTFTRSPAKEKKGKTAKQLAQKVKQQRKQDKHIYKCT